MIYMILSNNNVVFIFWSYDMFGELGFTEYIPSPTRCESLPRWDCSKKWDCGLRFFEFRYCYNNDINLIYINLIHIGLLLLFVVFSGLILFFSVFFFFGGGGKLAGSDLRLSWKKRVLFLNWALVFISLFWKCACSN